MKLESAQARTGQKPARSKGVTLNLDVTPLLRAGLCPEMVLLVRTGPGGPRWTKVDQTGKIRHFVQNTTIPAK